MYFTDHLGPVLTVLRCLARDLSQIPACDEVGPMTVRIENTRKRVLCSTPVLKRATVIIL